MDFDKTSFSVDWYTPGDKYAPKRLSFPKSARISIDDLVPDSPLSLCFSPVDGAILQSRAYPFLDTPWEMARGWPNSAPPSPLVPSHRDQDSPCEDDPTDWRALASPGLLAVADDVALCGVDLDVSCLDALDEQLLVSPVECFTELCWAAAVRDDVTAPVMHRSRSRAHSFKRDGERPARVPVSSKEYPGSFERTRPLAARIMLPLDKTPYTPSLPSCDSYETCPMFQDEKPLAYFSDVDPVTVKATGGFIPPLPVQDIPVPRRSKKRDHALTRPVESTRTLSQPSTPTKSIHTLRVISEAYSALTRTRRK